MTLVYDHLSLMEEICHTFVIIHGFLNNPFFPRNKDIKIYQTLEEMESDRYRHAASVDPLQGLRETVELILRAYGATREELNKRPRPTQITITKYE